jgi:hypothetical protein
MGGNEMFNIGTTGAALIVATVALWSAFPTAAHAYTQEQEQACSGDAMRLCSSDIPDVDRITACMARQRRALSPGCAAVFRRGPAATPVEAGMPLSLSPSKRQRRAD